MEQKPAQEERDSRLQNGDQDIKKYLAEQIFRAAERIGEHFVEDAVVAVQKKRPRGVRGDAETRHTENAREKKGVVVHARRGERRPESRIDAHAKDQHVAQRVEQIPKDKSHIRGSNLALPIKHCAERAHCASLPCINSTKMSSRLAPRTSTWTTRRFRASSLTISRTRASSALNAISMVFWSTL